MVEVEAALVVDLAEANDEVLVVRELEPRRDVAVVVELRDEDLVTCAECPADGTRQHEVERRHVRAEDRLARLAAEERRGRKARLREQRLGSAARAESAAEVRVRLAQVVRDRVDHRVGHLCPSGPVEERGRPAERGEARADGVDVEGDGAHPPDATGLAYSREHRLAPAGAPR